MLLEHEANAGQYIQLTWLEQEELGQHGELGSIVSVVLNEGAFSFIRLIRKPAKGEY
jgi:hypothetical protein